MSDLIPPNIVEQLEQLAIELRDGDITVQGYEKKKSKLLEPYQHLNSVASPRLSQSKRKNNLFLAHYDQLTQSVHLQDAPPGRIPNIQTSVESPCVDRLDSSEYDSPRYSKTMAPATQISASDITRSFISKLEIEQDPSPITTHHPSKPPVHLLPSPPDDLESIQDNDSQTESEKDVRLSIQSSANPSLINLHPSNCDDFDYTNPETMVAKNRHLKTNASESFQDLNTDNDLIPSQQETLQPSSLIDLVDDGEDLISHQGPPIERLVSYDKDSTTNIATCSSTVAEILRMRAQSNEKSTVFQVLDHKGRSLDTITFSKLHSKALKVAQMIKERSRLLPKSKIALVYRRQELIDFMISMFGCFYAGMIAVPIATSSGVLARDLVEINQIIQEYDIVLALTTEQTLKMISKEFVSVTEQGPPRIEWWKTNDIGSSKKAAVTTASLSREDVAYIDFSRNALGQLQCVEVKHKVLMSQCLLASKSHQLREDDVFMNLLETRQQFGLIMGFLAVYTGSVSNCPEEENALSLLKSTEKNKGKLNGNDLILVSRWICNYSYMMDVMDLLERDKHSYSYDLSSLKSIFLEAVVPHYYFHQDIIKALESFQFVRQPRLIPVLTIPELGGCVLGWKDCLDLNEGDDKLSAALRILLDNQCLRANKIRVSGHSEDGNAMSEMFLSRRDSDSTHPVIKLVETGFIANHMQVAIVHPDTKVVLPRNQVGEIWVRSQHMLPDQGTNLDTKSNPSKMDAPLMFEAHSRGFQSDIPLNLVKNKVPLTPMKGPLFFRTGFNGFLIEDDGLPGIHIKTPRLFVIGLQRDRIKQTRASLDAKLEDSPTTDISPTAAILGPGRYDYYYSNLIIDFIMSTVSQVEVCDFISCKIASDALPILLVEMLQDEKEWSKLCTKIYASILHHYGLQLFSICCCAPKSLPRLRSNIRSVTSSTATCYTDQITSSIAFDKERLGIRKRETLDIKKCQGLYIQGKLPISFVWISQYQMYTKTANSLHTFLPKRGQHDLGQIWGSALQIASKEQSLNSTAFTTISHLLIWRCEQWPQTKAFSCLDSKGSEIATLTYRKLSEKIAALAQHLVLKKNMKPKDPIIIMLGHGLDYIVSIYACLYAGIIPIPIAPIDSTRLHEDLVLLKTIMDRFAVKKILLNETCEEILTSRQCQGFLLPTKDEQRLDLINPSRITKQSKSQMSMNDPLFLDWTVTEPINTAMMQVHVSPDCEPTFLLVSHATLMEQCRIQAIHVGLMDEGSMDNSLDDRPPLLSCVRSYNGMGFLHAVMLGVYTGSLSLIVTPLDYFLNPLVWFETICKFQVKYIHMTYPMFEHAMNTLQSADYRTFSLHHVQSLLIAADGRIPEDTSRKIQQLFKSNRLQSHSISPTYSSVVNPIISARSHMDIGFISLFLDAASLRARKLKVVASQLYDNSVRPSVVSVKGNFIRIQDSGIIANNTLVAIVNPSTRQLCSPDEFGEIWVSSSGNMNRMLPLPSDPTSFTVSNALETASAIQGVDPKITFARTGDYGFMWPVPMRTDRIESNELDSDDMAAPHSHISPFHVQNSWETLVGRQEYQMALFVLGRIQDSIQMGSLTYFPQDIEQTIDMAHPNVVPESSVLFSVNDDLIAAIEIRNQDDVQSCIPSIFNQVLHKHQLLLSALVFVPCDKLPKSRLYEKQREIVKREYLKNAL